MIFNIELFPLYEENSLINECTTLHTKTCINDIENKLNRILDKHERMCSYYMNITDVSYCIELKQMVENMTRDGSFEIKIYKSIDNKAIVTLSRTVSEVPYWSQLHEDLLRKLS
jgi:hypothetical protein